MEIAMLDRAPAKLRKSSFIFGRMSRLKIALSILALVPLLAWVVIAGTARLLQSLDDGSVSPVRLLILVAHIIGCLMVVSALYNRGRRSRSYAPARRRII